MRFDSASVAGRELARGRWAMLPLSLILFAVVGGCGGPEPIKSLKTTGQMTDADRQKMADAMAAGNKKSDDEQKQWRIDHPAEAAKMDADRAKAGMPPIGKQ